MIKIPLKNGGLEYKVTIHDREKVMGLVTAGFTQNEIAKYLDISRPTLDKYFKNELENTDLHRTMRITNKLYRTAIKGNMQAIDIYLRRKSKAFAEKQEKTGIEALGSLLKVLVDQKSGIDSEKVLNNLIGITDDSTP